MVSFWILAILIGLAVVIGVPACLYGLHRFAIHLEDRGYIYYRNKPAGGGMSGAMFEMDKLTRPSVEHVAKAQEFQAESQEHDGD